MKPRKHAELIKAWADGAEIQFLNSDNTWWNISNPSWVEDQEYRLKPVPKADYTETVVVHLFKGPVSVRFTIDGETGEAKKVEIVK